MAGFAQGDGQRHAGLRQQPLVLLGLAVLVLHGLAAQVPHGQAAQVPPAQPA